MNWEAKRAQRAAALRALLDGDMGLPPAKSPPTVAQVTRVGMGAPAVRPVPPLPSHVPPSARAAVPRPQLVPRWVVEDPDSAVTHVHADEQAIRARLHRPCPPAMPLDLWLEMLAED